MKSQVQFLQLLLIAVLFVFNSTSLSYAKPQDKDRWNKKYDIEIYLFGEKPIPFLVDNIEILRKGKALCTYFMDRGLYEKFYDALKPGGMVLVETYNVDYLKYRQFNTKWALKTNELLDIFKRMRVLRYQDYDDAREAYSSIIAQKP